MSGRYQLKRDWGCIVAFIVGMPLLSLVLLVGAMSGGGCEGRQPPCTGNYTPMWVCLGVVLGSVFVLGWAIDRLVGWLRSRRDPS